MKKTSLFLFIIFFSFFYLQTSSADFSKLPKAELHIHLGGAFPKEYLFSIATEKEREKLETALALVANKMDYNAIFDVFKIVAELINSEDKLQKGVEALCLNLQEDWVHYVEIRTGLKDLGKGNEEYLKSILQGINQTQSDQFKAVVVLSLQRNSSIASVKETLDLALKYRDFGVVGIDISGNSTLGQIELILDELIKGKNQGLSYLVHMGEAPGEKDQLLLLQTLQPKRIGHGVYLTEEAKDWILKHQIPLEVCLTSSVLVKMIETYSDHPGFELFHLGHPIILCTDDPLLFSTSLSLELLRANDSMCLTKDEIKQIVKDSFDYKIELND